MYLVRAGEKLNLSTTLSWTYACWRHVEVNFDGEIASFAQILDLATISSNFCYIHFDYSKVKVVKPTRFSRFQNIFQNVARFSSIGIPRMIYNLFYG